MIRYSVIIVIFVFAVIFNDFIKAVPVEKPVERNLCASWVDSTRKVSVSVNIKDKKMMEKLSIKQQKPIYHDCSISVWTLISED